MARSKNQGNGRLEQALETLIQNQATFVQNQMASVQNQTALLARLADAERASAERFARIEAILLDHSRILAEHSRILAEHSRMLQALPEAVREKIGFKAPTP
jgi:hypothetical protein